MSSSNPTATFNNRKMMVRLSPADYKQLESLARTCGTSTAAMARLIILQTLREHYNEF